MKRVGILAFLMIIVIIGGVISSGMLNAPLTGLLITQTSDPNASTFDAPPQQAMQIIFWVGFVVMNVVGLALTLALVFWLINRALVSGRSSGTSAPANTTEAASE